MQQGRAVGRPPGHRFRRVARREGRIGDQDERRSADHADLGEVRHRVKGRTALQGGREQGESYVHNVSLEANFDLDRLLGVPKTTFRIGGSQRTGNSLSREDIGNAISVQQLYGGGQRIRVIGGEGAEVVYDSRGNWIGFATTGDDGSAVRYERV